MLSSRLNPYDPRWSLFLILFISLPQEVFAENHSVIVDPNVEKVLLDHETVLVSVLLDAPERLPYGDIPRTISKRRPIMEKNAQYFRSIEKKVLENLNKSDFELIRMSFGYPSFSGYLRSTGLEKLRNDSRVLQIDADRENWPDLTESVPLIEVDPLMWNQEYVGSGVTVCVVDTGIDWTHPSMGGCESMGPDCKVLYGYDYYDNDPIPMDFKGHGTHVAGIVSLDGELKGVAPKSHLIAMKACADVNGSCSTTAEANSIDWCLENAMAYNISVITMSIGGSKSYSDPDCIPTYPSVRAINDAYDGGLFVSVSSGNDGFKDGIQEPACARGAVSVGAVYDQSFEGTFHYNDSGCQDVNPSEKDLYCPTNRYSTLDLLAPGAKINSAVLNHSFDNHSGTSMATPHVAGAAALLQQAYNNTLTPDQIQIALKASGEPIWISDVKMSSGNTGAYFPLIRVEKALRTLEYLDTLNTDWPTYQHDNRRTGFTLLKGDMSNAKDVEQLDLLFETGRNVDLASRNVVADLDNNGHEEVLVWSVRGTMEDPDAWLYVFEMQDRGHGLQLRQRGSLHVGDFSNGAPIIANTDGDANKEIVVGLANGTVYLIDYTVRGEFLDLYLKWSQGFTVPEHYSPRTDDWHRGMIGIGMAAADLDADGTTEILFTDFVGPGLDVWSGQLYALHDNGNQYGLVTNITVGNGGSKGGVSVANVDNDEELEVIVGTYYALQVYDYVNNRLSLKWQETSFGSFSGAPVIYDYDRDNQYEILMTTSVSCSPYKTCSNSFYVFDAATGRREKWLLLSFFSPFTVALANLDTDASVEAALSFTYTYDTDKGGIACIDVAGERIDCEYTNSNTFVSPGYPPVIADIDGNGDNEILIPENNKSLLHVINGDGTQLFNYSFGGLIGSSPAIADIDDDGRAEIVVKRAGSPYSIMATLGSNNHQPYLEPMKPVIAIAGQTASLQANASDPDNDTLTLYYSAPFNETGQWLPTNNDTGDYTILVEASDGNLSHHQYVPVKVLPEGTQVINVFADGSFNKTLVFTEPGQVQRITIKIPKKAQLIYGTMKIEGKPSES